MIIIWCSPGSWTILLALIIMPILMRNTAPPCLLCVRIWINSKLFVCAWYRTVLVSNIFHYFLKRLWFWAHRCVIAIKSRQMTRELWLYCDICMICDTDGHKLIPCVTKSKHLVCVCVCCDCLLLHDRSIFLFSLASRTWPASKKQTM